ncbi:MAG TPA: TetR/AcrR family transcriptional regulator [Jiangellaceae bacterium]
MSGRRRSGADPGRTLALLWGPHGQPGRSGLSVRSIVAAAIELADTDGLDAVSMRHVAERLGVGTMSLYTHVPGKTELVDLMLDTVHGRLYADVSTPSEQPGGWRGALEFIAARNWALYGEHPWLLDVLGTRSGLGPNVALKYEAELRPLDGIGLSDLEMDSVLTLVLTHVAGTARMRADMDRTRDVTGQTDVEWWVETAPILERVMDASRFPVSGRVGTAVGEQFQASADPGHALTFGLARILDGVAELIASRQGG